MKYNVKEIIDETIGVVIRAMDCVGKYPIMLETPPMGSYNNWMLAETLKKAVITIIGKEMEPYIQVLNELKNRSETNQELLCNAGEAIIRLDERWKEMLLNSKRELDDLKLRLCKLEMKKEK